RRDLTVARIANSRIGFDRPHDFGRDEMRADTFERIARMGWLANHESKGKLFADGATIDGAAFRTLALIACRIQIDTGSDIEAPTFDKVLQGVAQTAHSPRPAFFVRCSEQYQIAFPVRLLRETFQYRNTCGDPAFHVEHPSAGNVISALEIGESLFLVRCKWTARKVSKKRF